MKHGFPWKIVMISGGIVLICLTVVLSVFQVRWINDSARAEKQRMETALYENASRAVARTEDEILALISLVVLRYTGDMQSYLNEVAESIRFWSKQAEHPELLEDVYIIESGSVEYTYRYSAPDGVFLDAERPALLSGKHDREDSPRISFYDEDLQQSGVFVIHIRPVREKGQEKAIGFVAVDIDLEVLYRSVIPANMKQYAPEYPFEVVLRGKTLYASTAGLEERSPDARIPFIERAGSAQPLPELPQNLVLRFWYMRTLGGSESGGEPPPAFMGDSESYVTAYYPGRSVNTLVERRRYVNLGMSLGISMLIIAALVLLYRMYSREEKLRYREREFLASMSHELRTPISVVRSISENIADGVIKDRNRLIEYGSLIRNHMLRLSRMVDSILLTAAMDGSARGHFERAEVNLSALIDEVVRSLSPTAEETGAEISVDTEDDSLRISSDATALRLVLENLLVNAIRHGNQTDAAGDKPGRIRVYAERAPGCILDDPRTHARERAGTGHSARSGMDGVKSPGKHDDVASSGDASVRLIVEDEGPGIPPKEIGRIFEPFFRGEWSVRNQVPGSGLGLHIVRRVVGMLGGSFRVETPYVGRGTGKTLSGARCIVTLPAEGRARDE